MSQPKVRVEITGEAQRGKAAITSLLKRELEKRFILYQEVGEYAVEILNDDIDHAWDRSKGPVGFARR